MARLSDSCQIKSSLNCRSITGRADARLLDSWRTEVCPFFIAWHTSSLEVEYRRFFTMTTAEKMNVPLSSLAIFLMICSLGCVMRASKMEIFGHPDRKVANEAKLAGVSPPRDVKDLTCSRLQSELYCKCKADSADFSVGRLSGPPIMLVHVEPHSSDNPSAGSDQCLPAQLGASSRRLVTDRRTGPAMYRHGLAC